MKENNSLKEPDSTNNNVILDVKDINPESPFKEHIPYWQRIQASLKEPETPVAQVRPLSPLKPSLSPESAKNLSKTKVIELMTPSPP